MEPWDDRSAELYELVFGGNDHDPQVDYVVRAIEERAPGARSLLDVACGTGWHLERFARRYDQVEGIDLSPAMLARARQHLSDVRLHEADMRAFDLGRTFDAVTCLSSSIAWAPADALDDTIASMARHLSPGGVLVVEPWPAPGEDPDMELPWATIVEGSRRTIALMETTTLERGAWIQETHYLIAQGGRIAHEVERAELTAFTRDDFRAAFDRAGLRATYDPNGPLRRGLWIGVRE